jgi:ribose 5-phosphate isomerase B
MDQNVFCVEVVAGSLYKTIALIYHFCGMNVSIFAPDGEGEKVASNEKTIAMGCDHAGLDLKKYIAEKLREHGYEIVDVGTDTPDSTDYPIYGRGAAEIVAAGKCGLGILVCGSGVGMSMVANKTRGVRAVVCTEPLSAKMSRLHNNSNVLCLGERLVGKGMAWEIVSTWLSTGFEGGRHERRVAMIEQTPKK